MCAFGSSYALAEETTIAFPPIYSVPRDRNALLTHLILLPLMSHPSTPLPCNTLGLLMWHPCEQIPQASETALEETLLALEQLIAVGGYDKVGCLLLHPLPGSLQPPSLLSPPCDSAYDSEAASIQRKDAKNEHNAHRGHNSHEHSLHAFISQNLSFPNTHAHIVSHTNS
jgi:hypothetical protein